MSKHTEIQPALTPEEWRAWLETKRRRNGISNLPPKDMWQLIATSNDALPDALDCKFTREDVALVERMIRGLDADHAWLSGDDQPAGAALAAKIAALLPPE